MNFRKSPGNIYGSIFPVGLTNYVICIGEMGNSNFFSAGSGFAGQIFTEEVSWVDSARALKQGVITMPRPNKILYSNNYYWSN